MYKQLIVKLLQNQQFSVQYYFSSLLSITLDVSNKLFHGQIEFFYFARQVHTSHTEIQCTSKIKFYTQPSSLSFYFVILIYYSCKLTISPLFLPVHFLPPMKCHYYQSYFICNNISYEHIGSALLVYQIYYIIYKAA